MNPVREDRNRSLVPRDTTWMEYSPREMAFVELGSGPSRQSPFTSRDMLRVLFRHKKLILAVLLTVVASVFVGLQLRTPQYEAQVKLLVRAEKQVESPYYRDIDGMMNTEVALTQSEIVKSNPVLERTVRELRLDRRSEADALQFARPMRKWLLGLPLMASKTSGETVTMKFNRILEELRERVRVKPISNTSLFTISARDVNPTVAARIANTVSRYYIIFDLEQQLAELQTKYGENHPAVMLFRADIQNLIESMHRPTASYVDIMGPASVKILEQARVPTQPAGIADEWVLLLACICGLGLGVGLAFLFENADPTIRSADDVRNSLNLPLLGSVPRKNMGARLLRDKPFFSSRYSKSFEDLADRMHVLMDQQGMRSMLFTAPLSGSGTSLIAFNLAVYLARHVGHQVLLVDSNFHRPVLHKLFKVDMNGDGFAAVLESRMPLEQAVHRIDENLSVLPAGTFKSNPLTILNAANLSRALEKAGESYDAILMDAANLKDFKDAEILSSAVNGVLVVVEAERGSRHIAKSYLSSLEEKKANLLGAILNKRVFHVPEILYGRV